MTTNIGSTEIGIVTCTGRLYCAKCQRVPIVSRDSGLLDSDPEGTPVYADAAPHNTEACDGCGKALVTGWFDDFTDMVLDKAARGTLSAEKAQTFYNKAKDAVDRILKA